MSNYFINVKITPSSESSVAAAASTRDSLARCSLTLFFAILHWFSRPTRNSYFFLFFLSLSQGSRLVTECYERLKPLSSEEPLTG